MSTDGCTLLKDCSDEGRAEGTCIYLHARREACDEDPNMRGQVLKDLCQMHDLFVVNGASLGDSIGRETCHTYNGASTVDWILVSSSAWKETACFHVGEWHPLISDHCLIQV